MNISFNRDSGTSLFDFIEKRRVHLSIARARLAWTCLIRPSRSDGPRGPAPPCAPSLSSACWPPCPLPFPCLVLRAANQHTTHTLSLVRLALLRHHPPSLCLLDVVTRCGWCSVSPATPYLSHPRESLELKASTVLSLFYRHFQSCHQPLAARPFDAPTFRYSYLRTAPPAPPVPNYL